MLSYSNDSKYKALFAQLNASQLTYIIKKRDEMQKNQAVPSVWNFRRIVRWSLLKAQEPHVVLLVELLIGCVMWANLNIGVYSWLFMMTFWAITAPLLAVARLVRYIHSSLITNDFHEWFKQASDV